MVRLLCVFQVPTYIWMYMQQPVFAFILLFRDGCINCMKLELLNNSGCVDNDQEYDAAFLYGFMDNGA